MMVMNDGDDVLKPFPSSSQSISSSPLLSPILFLALAAGLLLLFGGLFALRHRRTLRQLVLCHLLLDRTPLVRAFLG